MDNETELPAGLRSRDIKAFKALVIEYGEDMVLLAYILLKDPAMASDTVSRVLLSLWAGDLLVDLEPPLHVFLFSEVKRACSLEILLT